MRATKIAFERRYSDDSGVEYAVRFNGASIEFEAVDTVTFPSTELDWLIEALKRIHGELASTEPSAGKTQGEQG